MDDVTLPRAIHVLAVVVWIGGVALVTTVLLPAVRRLKSPEERISFFETVERRFASQSQVTTVLAGLSGLYIIHRLDLWGRFVASGYRPENGEGIPWQTPPSSRCRAVWPSTCCADNLGLRIRWNLCVTVKMSAFSSV